MPWRGPLEPKEFPTLGYEVGKWIEAHCVIPDGMLQGQSYRLTDEMWTYLVRFYRLHPTAIVEPFKPSAAFVYKGGQLDYVETLGGSPAESAKTESKTDVKTEVKEAVADVKDAAKAVAGAATAVGKEAVGEAKEAAKAAAAAGKEAVKAGAEKVKDAAEATKAAAEKK